MDSDCLNDNGFRTTQSADGPAAVLAIGTSNPANVIDQSAYPDFYFRVTHSEHLQDLKAKFKRICDKAAIKKRHLYLTEEILKENPSILAPMAPSFDARQAIVVEAIPALAKEAAEKALKEWGRPKSAITHLVFCSASGIDMPGADLHLLNLLGLPHSVNRVMLYNVGCHAGGTALRIAKDLAENNRGARVLAVCSEVTVLSYRGPDAAHLESLLIQALFGDGAAALVVGADPVAGVERPIFHVATTSQVMLPESAQAVGGHLREIGLTFHLENQLPAIIAGNIDGRLEAAFAPLGLKDWNQIFWVVHPGGRAILDRVEERLGLDKSRLAASRHVLSEYGNMQSATVLFILDEMRKRSAATGCATTGEGLEWGVLFGFGPGLSIETVVLRSVEIQQVAGKAFGCGDPDPGWTDPSSHSFAGLLRGCGQSFSSVRRPDVEFDEKNFRGICSERERKIAKKSFDSSNPDVGWLDPSGHRFTISRRSRG